MTYKMELQARALVLQLHAPQTSTNRGKAYLLIEAGYGTVEKLRAATDEELLGISGIGPVTLALVREYLAAL